jgi:ribose transport system substrate-binding protein
VNTIALVTGTHVSRRSFMRNVALVAAATASLPLLAACGGAAAPVVAPTTAPQAAAPAAAGVAPTTTQAVAPAGTSGAATALADLQNKVLSMGPNGEQATSVSEVKLSDDELNQIKAKKATAAIVMHFGGNDWSVAQIDGLKTQFGKMGIDVIATTDANFKPEKQVSDIETVLAKNPNIIVSIPTDPVATADAYKKAAAQGVKLVFMDNVPKGLQQGKDYVSTVSADNYGNGVASAHIMSQKLGGKGKIGIIFHAADFFVTRQRYDAFKRTMQDDHKDIQIVDEQGIEGPDFAGDAEKAATAMLATHADLKGIWAVWDVPGEGVMAALRSAGRQDMIVTTVDLGKNVAVEIAKDGIVKGLGAQHPFDQGVTEAMLAGYALLGETAPAYVVFNGLAVTRDNVLDAWKTVYHQEPPAEVQAAMKQ